MGLEKWYFSSGKLSDNICQEPQKYPPSEKINTPEPRKLYLGKDVQCPKVGQAQFTTSEYHSLEDTGDSHAFH